MNLISKKLVKYLQVVTITIFVTSCASSSVNYPEIRFASQKYHLDVSTSLFKLDSVSSELDEIAPYRLSEVVKNWASYKFINAGQDKVLKIVVKKAMISESLSNKERNFAESLVVGKAKEYKAELEVSLEIFDDKDKLFPIAQLVSSANAYQTVPESTSYEERVEVVYNLIDKVVSDLDRQVDQNINYYFSKHIVQQ